MGSRLRKQGRQSMCDGRGTRRRLQVPGKGENVTPMAFIGEQRREALGIARGERLRKIAEPALRRHFRRIVRPDAVHGPFSREKLSSCLGKKSRHRPCRAASERAHEVLLRAPSA